MSASVGNKLRHHGLSIQRFHTSRLAQSCDRSQSDDTETYQDPSSPCVILKAICAGIGWVWFVRLTSPRGEGPTIMQPSCRLDSTPVA